MEMYYKSKKLKLITRIINNSIKNNNSISILLEGVPGSGKTAFAKALANELDLPLYRYDCNEEANSDLILSFDLEGIIKRDAAYIKGALWLAFESTTPTILLIDEIDKSPKNFEAFLLRTTDELSFNTIKNKEVKARNPVIFIFTSNQRRKLSPEFKRRNMRVYLDYPQGELLYDILVKEVGYDDTIIEAIVRWVDKINGKIEPDELPAPKELGLLIKNLKFAHNLEDVQYLLEAFFVKEMTLKELNSVLSFRIDKAIWSIIK